MKFFLLGLIKFYRYFISPLLGVKCRFYPSCSEYAAEAISSYGAIKGAGLSIFRILRCQPFCRAGYDPVPGLDLAKDTDYQH